MSGGIINNGFLLRVLRSVLGGLPERRVSSQTGNDLPASRGEGRSEGQHSRRSELSRLGLLTVLLLTTTFRLSAATSTPVQGADDKEATFFMGRIKYSSNDGNDCGTVGKELMELVSKASTIKVQEERKVRLTDPELFETPFLFMNGHNNFVLTEAEVGILRKYLAHGGFFFASGCCTNPDFPKAWRREFSRIFPDCQVKAIPYDHLIYRSFYKIGRVRCLHEPRDIQLEGLFYQGNLVAVMCEDGLCCAFSANNTCNDGKGVSPEDGQKLALNIAVYALTH